MSASRVFALATLFLATTFAQAEWKEFSFSAGNFKVVFPERPQRLRGTQRNLHQFSATVGSESYGVAYADYSLGTDWKTAVNAKRNSIMSSLGASVVDERRTSVAGYPGKWIRFVGPNTSGELAIYFVGRRMYLLHAFAPKSIQRPRNLSKFLNSFRLLSRANQQSQKEQARMGAPFFDMGLVGPWIRLPRLGWRPELCLRPLVAFRPCCGLSAHVPRPAA